MKKMRTKKEIIEKEREIYTLINNRQLEPLLGVLYADVLEWVLGEDYLDYLGEGVKNGNICDSNNNNIICNDNN